MHHPGVSGGILPRGVGRARQTDPPLLPLEDEHQHPHPGRKLANGWEAGAVHRSAEGVTVSQSHLSAQLDRVDDAGRAMGEEPHDLKPLATQPREGTGDELKGEASGQETIGLFHTAMMRRAGAERNHPSSGVARPAAFRARRRDDRGPGEDEPC